MYKLRIRNAAQLVTITSNRLKYKCGSDMDKIDIIQNGTVVVNQQGLIEAIGAESDLQSQFSGVTFGTWRVTWFDKQ